MQRMLGGYAPTTVQLPRRDSWLVPKTKSSWVRSLPSCCIRLTLNKSRCSMYHSRRTFGEESTVLGEIQCEQPRHNDERPLASRHFERGSRPSEYHGQSHVTLLSPKHSFEIIGPDQVDIYNAIKVVVTGKASDLEYWHDSPDGKAGYWSKDPPPTKDIRSTGIIHETSTLYMSDDVEIDKHASVSLDYKPKGCGNVYVTEERSSHLLDRGIVSNLSRCSWARG